MKVRAVLPDIVEAKFLGGVVRGQGDDCYNLVTIDGSIVRATEFELVTDNADIDQWMRERGSC